MDISRVNIQALRRKIGSVLQDGKLFFGNIFENIAVASDNLTEEEAWEAAEIAGIADDIKSMPMGMNTVIMKAFLESIDADVLGNMLDLMSYRIPHVTLTYNRNNQ